MRKRAETVLLVVALWSIIMLTVSCKAATSHSDGNATIPPVPPTDIHKDNSADTQAVDPRLYGAKADGITDDGAAIQQAIDVCAQQGGGIVILKQGVFLSSPLILKSGVYLKVEAPAILKALPYAQYPGKDVPRPFLTATNAVNIGIFGDGTIDGNGRAWWDAFRSAQRTDAPLKRPNMIVFYHSQQIIVKGITLQNSPMFNFVPTLCRQVVVQNVTISNPADAPNTDGIDPSGCTDVFIDHCRISTGDDNIAIKATAGPTVNVYITKDVFGFGHGLSIGSDFGQGVENVYAKDCTFTHTTTGIRIKSARDRGGWLKHVHYSNMSMTDVGTAILITAYYPKIPASGMDASQAMSLKTPCYDDITIDQVTATATKQAGQIIGVPESPIQHVTLMNVQINAPVGMTIRNAQVAAAHTSIRTNNGSAFITEEHSSLVGN